MSYSIVGVVGHIDHGKTSLVAALTGIETDTHPEEKRRGITIDLGFAFLREQEHEFAFIDAPGHQKYIGNLLAGVSNVDIGLLVVACDQGIQEQTLEHVAILRTLGIDNLIVVISRVDLCDDSTRSELAEELELFLGEYGFADFPVLAVSSVTGAGLEELKEQLRSFARTADRPVSTYFRMPIDRVFSVPGRGCVVAGTVWSGEIRNGDIVQIARTGEKVRVRELEIHGTEVEQSKVGRRTAMNLSGISANDLSRGDELTAVEAHQTTSRVVVEVTMFTDAAEVRCPATIQLHTATTSCEARIVGAKRLRADERAMAVLETEEPIIATYGQQCLLRRPYPIGSFAGARIVASGQPAPTGVAHVGGPTGHFTGKQQKRLFREANRLASTDAAERLAAWVDCLGELEIAPVWSELQLGVTFERANALAEQAIASGEFQSIDGRLVSSATINTAKDYVVKLLTQQAAETNDAWAIEDSVIQRARTTGSERVVRHALQQALDEKRLVRLNQMIAVASDDTQLSKKQRARMTQLLSLYRDNRTPPTTKEAAAELKEPIDTITSIVRFAAQQRLLTDLGKGMFIETETFIDMCRQLKEQFQQQPELSVSEIRELWEVSRKYAIPLLEHCDTIGATRRSGDVRTMGSDLQELA